jgi:muconolactone delta-isomerase
MTGVEWPPREDKPRLDGYEKYYLIWSGEHEHVLTTENTEIYGEYIAVNTPKIIVTIPADLLFGEDLTIVYPDDVQEAARERVDEIWNRNECQALLHENALDTGYAGDGVWTVGREVDEDKGLAVIKTHPAETWFPEAHPDDVRNIQRHRLAWVKKRPNTRGTLDEYLRLVIHERGSVIHELWRLKDGKITGEADDGDWAYFYPDGRPEETQEGIEGEFLLVHVPNFRTSRDYYGQSEYKGVEPLFAAVNDRVTQVDGILARHSDPILELPHETWAGLTNGGKHDIDKHELKVTAKSETGAGAQYLTWDGKLDDNMAFIDQLFAQIGVVSETAPQLLGRSEWGGDLSGKALKILLLRTLAKVSRRRRYYDAAIPKLLELAQRIEGVDDPVKVTIEWPDGLPADVLEQIEEVDRRLANRTLDRKNAVKRLDGVNDEQADSMLSAVDEDDEAENSKIQSAVPQRQRPQINVNLGPGGEEI